VLLVLGRHLRDEHLGLLGPATRLWHHAGWIGVDLFFVLSGFLVGGLLFAEAKKYGDLHIGRFLIRRGFKIYPAFWAMIAATVAVSAFLGTPVKPGPLTAELLFIQNYKGPIWDHTWSLAVEEHFYLLLPLVIGLFIRPSRGLTAEKALAALPRFIVGLCVLILAVRTVKAFLHHRHEEFAYAPLVFRTHIRVDSLWVGVLLAYLHHFRREGLAAWVAGRRPLLGAVFLAGLIPALLLPIQNLWMHTAGFTGLALGAASLLLLALHPRRPGHSAAARAVAWLGSYSYSIYLWHLPWKDWSHDLLRRFAPEAPPALDLAVYIAGALVVGVALGALIEWPILRLRDRWFPSRSARAGGTALQSGGR
jgi:peptidoglycan/LPS O-acetylase OafA/YrhL